MSRQITIRIPNQEYEKIKNAAEKNATTISDFIRGAIEEYSKNDQIISHIFSLEDRMATRLIMAQEELKREILEPRETAAKKPTPAQVRPCISVVDSRPARCELDDVFFAMLDDEEPQPKRNRPEQDEGDFEVSPGDLSVPDQPEDEDEWEDWEDDFEDDKDSIKEPAEREPYTSNQRDYEGLGVALLSAQILIAVLTVIFVAINVPYNPGPASSQIRHINAEPTPLPESLLLQLEESGPGMKPEEQQ